MTHKSPDDIAALCSHAQLDSLLYQQFSSALRRSGARDSLSTETEVGAAPLTEPSETTARSKTAGLSEKTAPSEAAASVPPVREVRSDLRWLALQAVLEAGLTPSTSGTSFVSAECRKNTANLTLVSPVGGAGTTTILATLARILSTRKEEVVLVDGSEGTMLPCYFGARSLTTGSCTFRGARNTSDGPVHILAKEGVEPGGLGPEDNWLWKGLSQLSATCDRVLVDAWKGISAQSRERLMSSGACLVTLVPDLGSALHIRNLMELLRQQERRTGHAIVPYFLLNKFDASVPLHVDTRKWLAQQLGNQLLPFAIRRSDEVTEALAEGMTVMDYSPDSAIADDFLRLAEWLRAIPASRSSAAIFSHDPGKGVSSEF
ncbi:MAG: cellulose synthase operon protein YhjQ/BcsQ [Bryobacteraceae bacterium]